MVAAIIKEECIFSLPHSVLVVSHVRIYELFLCSLCSGGTGSGSE